MKLGFSIFSNIGQLIGWAMPRHWAPVFLAICGLLALGSPALAQLGEGTLTGQVRDAADRRPLVDVVVTATSPALQGEQTVVTDTSGTFRVPNLPPGDYTLRFEADTYRPYSRSAIQVRASTTLRVNADLLPETLAAAEVTVVAKAPTVDVGTTRSGITITNDFTSRIPVAPPTGKGGGARSFEQLAEVAPTVRNDFFGASVAGSTSPENLYMIDGLSVGDPGYGYNGTPLSIDFIKEATILTGGYLPEYGRGAGGVLDVVTKSGSNEFHGSVFANLTPWQARPRFPPPQVSINTTRRLSSVRDLGFDLGGPIIKDKLWFYVGADISRLSYTLTRTLNSLRTGDDGLYLRNPDGLILSDRIPGTERKFRAEQTQFQYIAKLTYSPTDDDRIELNHRGTPSWSGGNGTYSIDPESGLPNLYANPDQGNINGTFNATAWREVSDAYDTSIRWSHSALEKKLHFDTTLGWHYQRNAHFPSDGSEMSGGLADTNLFIFRRSNPGPRSITEFENISDPSLCVNDIEGGDAKCPVESYAMGGPQLLEDNRFHRLQFREVATFVTPGLGHHVFKAGLELEYSRFSAKRRYPGGVSYRESTNASFVSDYRSFGGLTGPDDSYHIDTLRYSTRTVSFGAFIQDSWAILDKVTVNAGIRYDAQFLFAEQGLGLALPNEWSPRLGVIWDPTYQGRAKLFVNYAIYYQAIPLNIMSRAGSGEPQTASYRAFEDCNPNAANYPAGCEDPGRKLDLNGAYDPNRAWRYVGTNKLVIDPDLKPPSSSEFSAGGEYEIVAGARIGVTYIRRWMNNVIEDMSRDEAATYFLGNPGKGIASDFPEAKRNYDAGIISFTKNFSEDWLAQASYTLSYLRGNWEGYFRDQTKQLDPGTNSDFDLRSLTLNRTGPLAGDRRHELKLFVARDVRLAPRHALQLGGTYRARSGGPTNYLGSHVLYGTDEVFILPRGEGDRLPWVHTIDVHAGYVFFQTKNQTLAVTADIFNLFNYQAVVRRGETYTREDVDPITGSAAKDPFVNGDKKTIDPSRITRPGGGTFTDASKSRDFGAPLEYQEPITIRFGIKTTF